MNTIPSVDLSDFIANDPNRKQEFVTQIGKAYEEIGFVAVKNHFLDGILSQELYKEVKAFFDLPLATKQQYEIEGLGGQRGYVSFGKEHAKGKKEGDLKEFWHFGQEENKDVPITASYPKNCTVKELEAFNPIGMKAYKMLEKTGVFILRALALYLNLEEHYFDQWVQHGNSILRPIHYPPITKAPENAVRAGAHGDINLITLLMGASSGGLQVQRNDGQWIDATPEPDELVVNVGDMLSRLTNDTLKSTIHRVVNPPEAQWHIPRYSIPFFMHPRSDMKLNCLPECISETRPKQYEDITAGDFLQQRLIEIGLIKPS